MQQSFQVTGMTCAACSAHVEKAVRGVDGVREVSVSLLTHSMIVEYDAPASDGKICEAVKHAGYGASLPQAEGKTVEADALEDKETPLLKKRLITSLILLIPLMYLTMGHLMWKWPVPAFLADNPWGIALTELLLTMMIMVINQQFFIRGFQSLWRKAPNMDALIALGSSAAFLYSIWVLYDMSIGADTATQAQLMHAVHGLYLESSATILTLITLGKMLEARSKGKTTDAIRSLMNLAPKTVRVLRDGQEVLVPVDELQLHDHFVLRPGDAAAVDGVVIEGISTMDESALTGESMPVDKGVGDAVHAGTMNGNGSLICEATRIGKDTTLQQIIKMVEQAAATKAPIAKIADRISGIFVPTVIVIALVTAVIWLVLGETVGFALARAISVLVISCPCALGLATPVAIMVGSGAAAKHGVLFKTAASLEAAGRTDIVVLDKTGTITMGTPQVVAVHGGMMEEKEWLRYALSVEVKSEHPLAQAIVAYAQESGVEAYEVSGFMAIPGRGVKAEINGKLVCGGNAAWMKQQGRLDADWEAKGAQASALGQTPMFFSIDDNIVGMIAVADVIKPDSKQAVEQMRDMGLAVVMLSGDNARTAKAIAEQVGIEYVIADVLPQDKEAAVARLSRRGKTAMVGDGINDAVALTRADIGMAVGQGSDIAIDAADVVLMKPTLLDVPAAIRLSRQVIRNIHENLFWAFFYNALGIPLAAGLLIPLGIELNPMFAAAAMSLSSFCVVTNALRLNLFDMNTASKRSHRSPIDLQDVISVSKGLIPEERKEETTMTKIISVDGMMCMHCVSHVKQALEGVDGVQSVDVSLEKKEAVVTMLPGTDCSALKEAITKAGYSVVGCREA